MLKRSPAKALIYAPKLQAVGGNLISLGLCFGKRDFFDQIGFEGSSDYGDHPFIFDIGRHVVVDLPTLIHGHVVPATKFLGGGHDGVVVRWLRFLAPLARALYAIAEAETLNSRANAA
ncbi:MAG: hypothetical protein [Circular genetic element sp.]|nr:MAG: hypothetical protein [Circular genetic element sp.]